MLRILQISPTYFSDRSMLGGGERYPSALAKELSLYANVQLISFGSQAGSTQIQGVPLEIYPAKLLRGSALNPLNFGFLRKSIFADILHSHQICTFVSDLTCLTGLFLGKPVFLTDHGGGGEVILHKRLPWIHNRAVVILQSEFTRRFISSRLQSKAIVIKGGVDTNIYCPDPQVEKDKSILFVGRILPHKGINYLLEAFRRLGREDFVLRIIGRVYDQRYYNDLKKAVTGLNVVFIHDATDEQVVRAYRQASIAVLPSVHTDMYGGYSATPELMGFTLLEAQASGTPVICTDAGAMSEFIQDGITGKIVKQNSVDSLVDALRLVLGLSTMDYERMGQEAHQWAEKFSWKNVALAHLKLYQASITKTKSS